MIIEFLKEEKCNEMFNLIKDCFNLEVNDNNIKEIIKSENCKAIIMKNKDELIGTAIIDTLNDYIKNQKYYYINYVCIKKEYRGCGYSKKIMEYIEELARQENISYIILTSSSKREIANKLYLSKKKKKIDTNLFKKEFK